jgi:hypothetical protein
VDSGSCKEDASKQKAKTGLAGIPQTTSLRRRYDRDGPAQQFPKISPASQCNDV